MAAASLLAAAPAAHAIDEAPVCPKRLSTRSGASAVRSPREIADVHAALSHLQLARCSGKAPSWPDGPGCKASTKPAPESMHHTSAASDGAPSATSALLPPSSLPPSSLATAALATAALPTSALVGGSP